MNRTAPRLALVLLALATNASEAQLPEKRFITPDGQRPTGLFAPGVMVGKTLYIAGKGDYKPNEEFPGKVRNCLGEIEKTLKQAGLGFEHVVKSFVYLEDHSKYDDLNKHYGEFFKSNPPARTTLGVAQVPGDSQLEITCIAYADLSQLKVIGQPPGRPYSPGILAGDTLYISGKGDQNPDGTHPATFEEQVRQSLKNVAATLKDAGLDFRHVVMSHLFIDDPNNSRQAIDVYGEFFGAADPPAMVPTVVDWIPGGSHVEITCIATTNLSARRVIRPTTPELQLKHASPAVWAGNTLYLSGAAGVTGDGKLFAAVGEQVQQIARNHATVIKEAGLTSKDIVSGLVYLADIEDYQAMNGVYREHFSAGPGVRTTLMPTNKAWSSSPGISPRVTASLIAAKTQPENP